MSTDERKKSKKQFGQEEYKKVHRLVYEYQTGSQEAAEELIESFSKFFTKYIALIKFGIYDLSHYSTRSFIKLFVHDSKDKKLINPYLKHTVSTKYVVSNAISLIQQLFATSTVEDIKQDLQIIFLNMCNKYKDTKPSFHYYVDRTFHFNAYRYFEKMIRDPIARGYTYDLPKNTQVPGCENENISMFDILADEKAKVENDQTLHDIDLYYSQNSNVLINNESNDIYDSSFMNTNWINGATCNNIFACLDPSERRIIQMWYVENKTDLEIAEAFGVCRGTINRKRNVAKEKLKTYLEGGK